MLSDAATHDVMSYMSCPVFETGYQELSSGSFVHMMDSRRFHVSPDPDTGLVEYQRSLHKMAQDGASVAVPANIPADDPRGVSFMDGAGQFQFLDYINFFDFLSETVFLNEELADFQRWLDNQTSENLELLIEGVDSFLEDSDDDSQVLMTSLLPGITVSGVTYGVDDYEYRAVVMMALYKSINGRLADVEVQYFGNTFADFSKKSGSEVSDVYRNWVDMPQTFDQFREEK
ncbi:MAG: hypothetical protein U9Q15_01650 [Patescibacteria group bacterium]|nr:hypothetical protein [Patescibacteria group bacterium]